MLVTAVCFWSYWFVLIYLEKIEWYYNIAPFIGAYYVCIWLASHFSSKIDDNIQAIHFSHCVLTTSYLFLLLWQTNMDPTFLMLSLLGISVIGGMLADFRYLLGYFSGFFLVSLFLPNTDSPEQKIFFCMSIFAVGIISGIQFKRRLKMLEMLSSDYKRFHEISEGNYGGIIIFHGQEIKELNSTFKNMFAIDQFTSLNDLSISDLFGLDAYNKINEQIISNSTELCHQGEFLIQGRYKNNFYVEYKLKPIEIDGQKLTAMFLKDISDMKLSENIISEQAETLKRVSRLSDLGELSAGIAHEINNPLAIISGMADEVLFQLENDEDIDRSQLKFLGNKIIQNTERISKIIKGLRAFVRDGSTDPFREEKLSKILQESIDICQTSLAKKNIELRYNKEHLAKDILISCRAIQLEQVIVNIINNAKDAICDQEHAWIEIDSSLEKDFCEITITDSGSGIPFPVQKKIFDTYYTTKSAGRGTGLGLSIARQIIEEHNGSISLDAHHHNTRFIIRIPSAKNLKATGTLDENV
jgi:signal transduction histidine kinase